MNCKSMSHHFAILKEDAHSVLLNSIGFVVKNSLAFWCKGKVPTSEKRQ